MTVIKVCGVGDRESALAAARAGADLVGFHLCDSPRRIDAGEARSIVDELRSLPGGGPGIVGVFLDQPEDEVERLASLARVDHVQLHGHEAPGFRSSRPLLKVLRVGDQGIDDDGPWPEPLLLDSWSADGRGGTGRTWRWERAAALAARRRVMLAGGLTPANVAEAVRALRPWGVDVSSGVETDRTMPGRKDPALMAAFCEAVRDVDAMAAH